MDRAAYVAMFVAALLTGVHAYRVLIFQAPPLHADEAGHALPAARMTIALRGGDVSGFVAASLNETLWPFLHPWAITPFFLLFGISARVARLSSLLTYACALSLVPRLARRIAPREAMDRASPPPLVGWLSVAILVTATPWDLVCTVMSEPLGMLLTLAALLVAVEAGNRQTLVWHACSGLLAASAFFTKYSYGLPLMFGLFSALALRAGRSGKRPLVAAIAGALSPVLIWAFAILAPNPRRASEMLGALVNRDEGLRGLTDALFYGRVVLDDLGRPIGVIVLFLLALTVARRKAEERLPLLLFVGIALLLLTLHPNKQQRYLFPVLPVMVVLAETEAARYLSRRRGFRLVWPALSIAVLLAGAPLARLDEAAATATTLRGAGAIIAYVADNVPADRPALFLGTTGLLPHLALTWELIEREQRDYEVDLLPFPGDAGWDPRFRSGYPSGDGPEYDRVLREALASGRYGSVVALALGSRSPFRPDWLAKWDAWGQNYVRAVESEAAEQGYVLRSERSFPEEDARVRIFVPRE